MKRFTRAELLAHENGTVDDIIGPDTELLFVGVNPGLWTAAVNAPYAYPGNRFWPALERSGLVQRHFDASHGLSPADRADFVAAGLGSTNFVNRATIRADELSADELRAGAAHLDNLVMRVRPRVVAVLGIMSYRTAYHRPKAHMGLQAERLAGAELWVLPNSSGLNAHETIDSIAAKMREVGVAARLLEASA
ncbi:mismatch-specific DNA-glycosylase [Pseudoclavibacter sp. CFCC 11306]|uniref:mismatch-specific DNA-glycosylase n=1 Tax=Pseudoclavibacter sp. CFCC 11306 TaxID=1564493 RepID=UPI0013016DCB|nr:mismatch-specific DNA-glycosylase [Pseudoclavibacter sp. CFCC 11306]KAB1657172.1 mismatch-specific DNA-glycosylase [Pseudoclavibacter sp. CFCC 11306]